MGARKLDGSDWQKPQPTSGAAREIQLALSPESVLITQNGIEFYSRQAFPLWTEMTIRLVSARDRRQIDCVGVVVGCRGNRQDGYHVTLLFTDVSPKTRAQLISLSKASWSWL